MKLTTDGIQISINFDKSKRTANSIPIFLLHGFTGKGSDWDFLLDKLSNKYFPIKIDIVGHGKSDSPSEEKNYSETNLVDQLHSVVKYFGCNKNIFIGYSMGGRIALSYSTVYPNSVSGLILESTSPGIENETERKLRVENDTKLALTIKDIGINGFINNWMRQPFFNSLKNIGEIKLSKIIKERCLNNPIGLSNILAQFSQGKMLPKWDKLSKLNFPVLLISGSLDNKYCEVNKKASEAFKNSDFRIVENSGHNVHLEKEEEFVNFVNSFLEKHF